MKIQNNFSTSIHLVLRDLIEKKSKRDQIKFTSAQLASALCMPRSMITKLTHFDSSKRVINPRIDTLLKIVEFFKADGFNITVNDLLGITTKSIDVQEQKILIQKIARKIPLYSSDLQTKKIGNIDIKIYNSSQNIFAIRINKEIKPFFKNGSIFIIDKDQNPEDDMLVAVNFHNSLEIQIKKFHIENGKRNLSSLDYDEKRNIPIPNPKCKIIGVVIQINAKT